MVAIGKSTEKPAPINVLGQARTRAASIPDLLVDAQRIAATVAMGWHGRRMRGAGENFWQFRLHNNGESALGIDWRRSARDDNSYVREKEWDAAHTVWLWADASPSMQFQSNFGNSSKADRALLIALALAELLSRSGERIAWPNISNPSASRDGATRLAVRLAASAQDDGFPEFQSAKRFSDIVIASDFSEPEEDVLQRLAPLFKRGLRGHLVEVLDPVEEDFPYSGHTVFAHPQTGERITANRADSIAVDYRRAFLSRRDALIAAANQYGWTYTISRTDAPATAALVKLQAAFAHNPKLGNNS
jgi:uncharacterized protein (DUF58 family)